MGGHASQTASFVADALRRLLVSQPGDPDPTLGPVLQRRLLVYHRLPVPDPQPAAAAHHKADPGPHPGVPVPVPGCSSLDKFGGNLRKHADEIAKIQARAGL